MERKVMQTLIDRAGERVTRYELLETVHGPEACAWAKKHGLANSTEDRQNREIIEHLQAKEYPIVSSSGQAGYILAADEETTDNYLKEMIGRRESLDKKISAVRKSKHWISFIREWKANRPATQTRLL
jgi:hypothetical protein